MRVVIFEPNYRGHYLMYVALVVRELLRAGVTVVLSTSKAAHASQEFRQLIAPIADRIEVDAWMEPELPAGTRGALDRASRIAASVSRAKAMHAMIMHADRVSTGLVLRHLSGAGVFPKGCEAEGLYFSTGLAMPQLSLRGRAHQRAVWEVARRAPFSRFHHLDPRALDRIRRESPRESQRWRLMPDPVEPPAPASRAEMRRKLGFPEGGRVIGCPGVIDRRKGCDLLLRAFADARRAPDDRLLLLGPQEAEIRALIAKDFAHLRSEGSLLEADRLFAPADLGEALQAMDLIVTPYPRHVASASVAIRAAAASRPVLAARIGWLQYTVPRFGLGWLCNVEDPAELSCALMTSLDAAASWKPAPVVRQFAAFHSPENFALSWSARLRERLELPALPLLGWEDVERLLPPRARRGMRLEK